MSGDYPESRALDVMSGTLPIPLTGELVDLADPSSCAAAIDSIRYLERQLRDAKTALTQAIADEAARQGVKTLELEGGRKAVISGGPSYEYDAGAVENGLRAAGMPEDRIRQIVEETVSYQVRASEAKRAAAANPAYAAVIEAARRQAEKPYYVSLRIS